MRRLRSPSVSPYDHHHIDVVYLRRRISKYHNSNFESIQRINVLFTGLDDADAMTVGWLRRIIMIKSV